MWKKILEQDGVLNSILGLDYSWLSSISLVMWLIIMVNTWQWIGGTGPFADLKGIIMTGAYLQLGQNKHGGGNFIWKGTATGISDKIIKSINSFTKKAEE